MVPTDKDDTELVDYPGNTNKEIGQELFPLISAPASQSVPNMVHIYVLSRHTRGHYKAEIKSSSFVMKPICSNDDDEDYDDDDD